jgi:hypothetical protein
MANNEYVGSASALSWTTTNGTTDLWAEGRNVTYTPSIDLIDATAGADTYKRKLASYKDASLTVANVAQTDGTLLVAQCPEGQVGTMLYYPAGTAVGREKVTMPAISMGVTRTSPYNDVVTYGLSFSSNGPVVYGTN